MKNSLLFLAMLYSFLDSQSQTSMPKQYHLLIGTYASEGKPNGIHVYRFNSQNGEFRIAQPVTNLSNASYLAISADRRNVYAVSEGGNGGSVNAYSFDPSSGLLTFQNNVPSQGPCYVSVDDKKQLVFSGNYGGGSVLSIQLNKDGSFIKDKVQTIEHEGSSVIKERQEKPHVHSVVLSPDNNYLLVPDLGTDKVYQYRVDAAKVQALTAAEQPFLNVKAGGGPRHIVFHPNGKYAYLVLELEAAVMAIEYKEGKLKELQTISMVASDFKGRLSGADIHVSPEGKFLYASNRGDANEIAIYAIDKSGKLSLINIQSVLGKTPRNFVIDPTGNFLLVANQNSNEIIVFKRNVTTGMLESTGTKIEVDKPVCLKFVEVTGN